MTTQSYRWVVAPIVPPTQIRRLDHLSPLIVQILYNRGITDRAEADAFLAGEHREESPFRMKGMNEAVGRIRQALRAGEPIAVYGDFDADGVTSTALLVQVLKALAGRVRVRPYIPHRVDEGYGLNNRSLRHLHNQGIRLVITVDCGIRATDQVAYGRRLGLDIIVSDHHSVPDTLPPASAVINPRQPGCRYAFKDLAGVGVAFKLAQALLRANERVPLHRAQCEITQDDLTDLVALGTVADMVPLLDENRALVKRGLEKLNAPYRPGIQALIAQASVKPGTIDAETIGYVLGPRLNAAGRMEHAMTSYRLLMASTLEEAEPLANDLGEKNRLRQQVTKETFEQARQQVTDRFPQSRFLMAMGRDFLSGIVGLVSSRLTEDFYRPSAVLTLGEDESRGSARSIPEFNIIQALDECADLLEKHGGHAGAAGFTVRNENLPALQARLEEIAARELEGVDLVPTLCIDAEVPLQEVNWATQALLQQLAPFGYANPTPLLLSRGVRVRRHRLVGDDHLKLTLDDGRIIWDAIAFRQGHWAASMPDRVDLVYNIEVHEWNGQKRLQLNVKALRPAEN